MKKQLRSAFMMTLLLALLLAPALVDAQYKISGTVIDNNRKPVSGASVYLENTLDGGTTDSTGVFRFTTTEKGSQTIVASEVSHETGGQPIVLNGDVSGIVITIKANKAHDLDVVTITAGSYGASNDKTKTVLNPMDIVTTAGANADVVKAIEMLPGTQKTGTDNGMFVRGGDASESQILVDEMVVQNAFFSGPPGVTTRSRFSAFQYQGVAFSSGGYSARYGQALSGVLELNSTDLSEKSTVTLGVNTAGLYASGTKKWKNASLDVGGNYLNLTPFYGLATTNFKFYKIPVGGGGNIRYAWKPNKDGILKITANTSYLTSGIAIPNPYAADTGFNIFNGQPDTLNFVTKDQYYYTNVSYKQLYSSKYSLFVGASYSLDKTNNTFGTIPINEQDHRVQFRIEGKDYFTSRLNLLVGSDVQSYGINKSIVFDSFGTQTTFPQLFTETIVSGYTELEWTPINNLAIRPGIRYEHSELLNTSDIAPRLSLALKTGKHTQVSVAGGIFYQDPDNTYLEAGLRPGMQEAVHYIANWQYTKNDRTLRIEGYYKKYENLVRTPFLPYDPNSYQVILDTVTTNNSGHGYAQGAEVFWRDKKSFKNVDYWISYSYIDTKRLYGAFPVEATPTFVASNNLNLVGKYFVDKWQTNFSATYSFATGRPYYNPNLPQDEGNFLTSRTPDYNNLAIEVAYLHTFGKWFTVFYVSVDNITNSHNIFGYRYIYNAAGTATTQYPIVPALYRTIFFGVNMSLTQFKKDEL